MNHSTIFNSEVTASQAVDAIIFVGYLALYQGSLKETLSICRAINNGPLNYIAYGIFFEGKLLHIYGHQILSHHIFCNKLLSNSSSTHLSCEKVNLSCYIPQSTESN